MKLWIARDGDGSNSLWLYNAKPDKQPSNIYTCTWKENGEWGEEYELDKDMFPEITFENSPREVELKLVK